MQSQLLPPSLRRASQANILEPTDDSAVPLSLTLPEPASPQPDESISPVPQEQKPTQYQPGFMMSVDAINNMKTNLALDITPNTLLSNNAETRQKLKDELCQTEYTYVKGLAMLRQYFLNPILDVGVKLGFKSQDILSMSSGIESLMVIHSNLFIGLCHATSMAEICKILLETLPLFYTYADYCKNQPTASTIASQLFASGEIIGCLSEQECIAGTRKELWKETTFGNKEKDDRLQVLNELVVSGVFISPVQRLPRYLLLLQQLEKTFTKTRKTLSQEEQRKYPDYNEFNTNATMLAQAVFDIQRVITWVNNNLQTPLGIEKLNIINKLHGRKHNLHLGRPHERILVYGTDNDQVFTAIMWRYNPLSNHTIRSTTKNSTQQQQQLNSLFDNNNISSLGAGDSAQHGPEPSVSRKPQHTSAMYSNDGTILDPHMIGKEYITAQVRILICNDSILFVSPDYKTFYGAMNMIDTAFITNNMSSPAFNEPHNLTFPTFDVKRFFADDFKTVKRDISLPPPPESSPITANTQYNSELTQPSYIMFRSEPRNETILSLRQNGQPSATSIALAANTRPTSAQSTSIAPSSTVTPEDPLMTVPKLHDKLVPLNDEIVLHHDYLQYMVIPRQKVLSTVILHMTPNLSGAENSAALLEHQQNNPTKQPISKSATKEPTNNLAIRHADTSFALEQQEKIVKSILFHTSETQVAAQFPYYNYDRNIVTAVSIENDFIPQNESQNRARFYQNAYSTLHDRSTARDINIMTTTSLIRSGPLGQKRGLGVSTPNAAPGLPFMNRPPLLGTADPASANPTRSPASKPVDARGTPSPSLGPMPFTLGPLPPMLSESSLSGPNGGADDMNSMTPSNNSTTRRGGPLQPSLAAQRNNNKATLKYQPTTAPTFSFQPAPTAAPSTSTTAPPLGQPQSAPPPAAASSTDPLPAPQLDSATSLQPPATSLDENTSLIPPPSLTSNNSLAPPPPPLEGSPEVTQRPFVHLAAHDDSCKNADDLIQPDDETGPVLCKQ